MATDPNAPEVNDLQPGSTDAASTEAPPADAGAQSSGSSSFDPASAQTSDPAAAPEATPEAAPAPATDTPPSESGTTEATVPNEGADAPVDLSAPAHDTTDTTTVGNPAEVAPATDNTTDAQGNTIIVPSGAAATPNSPPSTHAMNALTAPENTPTGTQDPALLDPTGTAAAGKEGTSVDPATRVSDGAVVTADDGSTSAGDNHPDNVSPAPTEGAKASDAGVAAYPFPAQGDVEVALVPTDVIQGEKMAVIEPGDFVILGEHELIPERFVGAEAAVIDAPTILCNCDWAPRTHEHVHPTAGITVRTRDDANATFVVPLAALRQILRGGRISR